MESYNRSDTSKEEIVLDEYAKLLQPHIDAGGGMMELLPANPELYPGQEYDRYHIEGDPQHAGTIEFIAKTADERFPRYIEALHSPEQLMTVHAAGEIMKSGGNIILLTNHGSLIDIALALAGNYCVLDRVGYRPKTGLIINKTISRIGYVLENSPPVPATDILKLLCNDIYMSFPRTESMMKSRIASFLSDDVGNHNRRLRRHIGKQLDEGGYLLAVAGSGSTDKPDSNDPNTIRMGTMSNGMVELLRKRHTLVLPMAIRLHKEEAVFDLCGGVRAITTPAEAHDLMQQIASHLTRLIPDKTFEYRVPAQPAQSLGRKIIDRY